MARDLIGGSKSKAALWRSICRRTQYRERSCQGTRKSERNREIKMVRVRAGVVLVLFLLVACFSFQQLFASDDTVMNLSLLLPLQLLEF